MKCLMSHHQNQFLTQMFQLKCWMLSGLLQITARLNGQISAIISQLDWGLTLSIGAAMRIVRDHILVRIYAL